MGVAESNLMAAAIAAEFGGVAACGLRLLLHMVTDGGVVAGDEDIISARVMFSSFANS